MESKGQCTIRKHTIQHAFLNNSKIVLVSWHPMPKHVLKFKIIIEILHPRQLYLVPEFNVVPCLNSKITQFWWDSEGLPWIKKMPKFFQRCAILSLGYFVYIFEYHECMNHCKKYTSWLFDLSISSFKTPLQW